MKSKCDPNGIRTRVTAVKGRCPRPLDDRVIRQLPDGQYRNSILPRKVNRHPYLDCADMSALFKAATCRRTPKGKLPNWCKPCAQSELRRRTRLRCASAWRAAPWLRDRMNFVNERRYALGCAFVRAQNFARILDNALPRFGISQKFNNCSF